MSKIFNRFVINSFAIFLFVAGLLIAIKAWAVDQKAIDAIQNRQKQLGVPVKKDSESQVQINQDRFSVSITVPFRPKDKPEDNSIHPASVPEKTESSQPKTLTEEKNISISTSFFRKTPTVEKQFIIQSPRMSYLFRAMLDSTGIPGSLPDSLASKKFSNETLQLGDQWWLIYDNDTDVIAYNQGEGEDSSVELKEWIYAREPNAPTGSRYNWSFSAMGRRAHIKPVDDKRVGVHQDIVINGLAPDNEKERERIIGVVKKAMPYAYVLESPLTAVLEPVVYWTNDGIKREGRYEITGRNTVSIAIDEQKKNYPLVIDPTINWGNWLGSPDDSGGSEVNAIAINGTEIYAGGDTTTYFRGGATTIAGAFNGGTTEGFVVEMTDAATPTVNWLHWVGTPGTDVVNALAVNGDEIYAGGNMGSSTGYVTVNSVLGTFLVNLSQREGFVVKITDSDTTGTPSANWLHWFGGSALDSVLALAVTGDEVYAGGYLTLTSNFETIPTVQGTVDANGDGFVVEIDDNDPVSAPSAIWVQWLGGNTSEQVTSLAINGDEIFAGGWTNGSGQWDTTASTERGTMTAGAEEGFAVRIIDNDGTNVPSFNWLQWLGGKNDDQVLAMALSGDEIYAGGWSSSPSGSFETFGSRGDGFGNKIEGFVVEISDPPGANLTWLNWVGSSQDDAVNALAINGNEIYAGGYLQSTGGTQTAASTIGTFAGGTDAIVVEIADNDGGGNPAISARYWLGNDANDAINGLAVSAEEIYAGGYANSSNTAPMKTANTVVGIQPDVKGGMVFNITDGSINEPAWLTWLGGVASGATTLTSLAVNGDEIYAGGYSTVATLPAVSIIGTMSGGLEGLVVEIADGTSPSVNWLQWFGGTANDFVTAVAVNNNEVYAAGYASTSNGIEAPGLVGGTYTDNFEGFVIEINDGSPPVLNWRQWLGAVAIENILALTVNGDEIYAGGFSLGTSTVSWDTTAQGAAGNYSGLSEGFVVEIADGPTLNWRAWLGGVQNDQVTALAVTGNEIYAGGWSSSSTTNFEVAAPAGTMSGLLEGWVVELADDDVTPGAPTYTWMQLLGGSSDDYVTALALNGDEIFVGGQAATSDQFEAAGSTVGTFGDSFDGFVVKLDDGLPASFSWLTWLGCNSTDVINALAVTGEEIYAGGYMLGSTEFIETFLRPVAGTGETNREGFVVEILDGAPPKFYWNQWLGGDGQDQVNALAITGDEIYAAGITTSDNNWETSLQPTNGKQVGFFIELQDDRRRVILAQ